VGYVALGLMKRRHTNIVRFSCCSCEQAVTTRMLRPLRAAILEKYPRLVVRETDATTMTESDATAHLMHVLVGDSEKDLACRYAEAGLEDDVLKVRRACYPSGSSSCLRA